MGAAFSGASLCRIVGIVETVVSSVILAFGAQTLHLFYSMDEILQEKFVNVQYSAITAITQGSLTILASLMLFFASRQKPGQPYLDVNEDSEGDDEEATSKKGSVKNLEESNIPRNTSYISSTQRIKKKLALIYRLWLAFSVISIGLLLVIFLCPMSYCIQNQKDKERFNEITDDGKNMFYLEDGKKKPIAPCYAESKETLDIRTALADLYSYCLVNIFTIAVFMFVVYYQLKRVTRWGNYHKNLKEDKQTVLPQPKNEVIVKTEDLDLGLGVNSGAGDGH